MSRHDHLIRRALPLALGALAALSLSLAAVAAEKVAPEASGPASEAPPAARMPAVPENAEEAEALKGQATKGEIVTRRPAHTLTPMMAEIFAYMEAREVLIAAKRQQYAAAKTDAAAAASLQAEMQKLKFDTEIEVLRIQARHAHKEGRTEDARRIEASIEEILKPQIRIAPEKRPLPQTPAGR